jgi:hypothetical protein
LFWSIIARDAIIPKQMVAKELVQGLRLLRFEISRSYIYHICTEKWPDVYNSSVDSSSDGGDSSSSSLSNIRQIDEDKDTEDSARRLIENGTVTEEEIKKGPATMDFHRDFYNDSEIELDSAVIYEIQMSARSYPDKIFIRQQKGKAIEVARVVKADK